MMPVGLETWELITVSAICALTALSVFTTIGLSLAYFLTREPRAVEQPATDPAATKHTVAPTFAQAPIAG